MCVTLPGNMMQHEQQLKKMRLAGFRRRREMGLVYPCLVEKSSVVGESKGKGGGGALVH